MMERDNYFILLELDIETDSDEQIKTVIEEKKLEWSRGKNHPSKGNQCQNNLDQVKEIKKIMLNATSRKDEREAAKKIKEPQIKSLKKLIKDVTEVGKGFITKDQLEIIVKKYNLLTKKEIHSHISCNIIKEGDDPQKDDPQKEIIASSTLTKIEKSLKIVGKKNLYHFLELCDENCKTVPVFELKELKKKIEEDNDKIKNNNNTNGVITAKIELYGLCRIIFKDEEQRNKYNNSLLLAKLKVMDSEIDIFSKNKNREINSHSLKKLLDRAADRGISRKDAEEYIISYASEKFLKVKKNISDDDLLCVYCGTLNKKTDNYCSDCKKDLMVTCLICNNKFPSEKKFCSICGFSIGKYDYYLGLLKDAESLLVNKKRTDAKKKLEEAARYWPKNEKINVLMKKIEALRNKEKNDFEDIEKIFLDTRLYKAQMKLKEFKVEYPDSCFENKILNIEEDIEQGFKKAKEHINDGDRFTKQGKTREAENSYIKALEVCKDETVASKKLAAYPPLPPEDLKITIDPKNHIIKLNWNCTIKGNTLFKVVRKKNSKPLSINDGEDLGETPELNYEDSTLEPGVYYFYAVYSTRGDIPSETSAISSKQIILTPDIENLKITPDDNALKLEWKTPKNAKYIEIVKKAGALPESSDDGKKIHITGNSYSDKEVQNDVFYGYLIYTIYEDITGKKIYSKGISNTSTPTKRPDPLNTLSYSVENDHIVFSWKMSTKNIEIYVSNSNPQFSVGDLLIKDELNKLGNRSKKIGPNKAKIEYSKKEFLYFVPVTEFNATYIVGNYITYSNIEDVSEISSYYSNNQLDLKWKWPSDINHSLISLKRNNYATKPNDGDLGSHLYDKKTYEMTRGFRCDVQNTDFIYVTIFSAIKKGEGWEYSSGVGDGCRTRIAIDDKIKLKYCIKVKKKLLLINTNEYDLIIRSNKEAVLPELTLKAMTRSMPISSTDGTEILRINEGEQCSPKKPFIKKFSGKKLPKKLQAKLFAVNKDDFERVQLIRSPETCDINM